MFSALSYDHGQLQDKLNLFIACAPIINLANSPNSLMQNAASVWRLLEGNATLLGAYELGDPQTDKNMKAFCSMFSIVCNTVTDFLNFNTPWNDAGRAKISDARDKSSASLKQVVHYAQIFNTGIYRQFDYGSDKANIARYGNAIIPSIPLWQIDKVPIAYFVGLHDDLGDPIDTDYTFKQIKTAFRYRIYDDMDHYSFQTGVDMGFTADALSLVAQYNVGNLPGQAAGDAGAEVEATLA